MARLVPGLARVVGVDTGQLYSLARDAEGGVLGVQGLLIRAALRTWQAPCSSLPPASWPTGRGRQHRGQQGRQGPLQQAHQQAQGNKSEGNIYCISFTPPYIYTSNCDGLVTPSGCSGLAIVSRFAFDEVSFVRFKIQGSPWNMFLDGEFFAGKGLGRVTVKILPNMAVDFLVTHLVSESNYKIREAQAHELVQVVIESQADFVVLAGDFNTAPMTESDRTYNKVAKVMADAFQEAKGDPSLWHDPHFATYGHTRNSYTNANSHPTIFDYIFLRKSTMDPGEIWVKSFSLPDLHIVKPATQTQISISDHEGVASHIYLWKQ